MGIAALIDADGWIWVRGNYRIDEPYEELAKPRLRALNSDISTEEDLSVVSHREMPLNVTACFHELLRSLHKLSLSLRRLVIDELWESSQLAKICNSQGHTERLISFYEPDDNSYNGIVFLRRSSRLAFTLGDRTLVDSVFSQVAWFNFKDSRSAGHGSSALSPREWDVLNLLIDGNSRKEVACHLDLSTHTVADHLKEIYRKLGVRTRGQLLAKFIPRDNEKSEANEHASWRANSEVEARHCSAS